MRRLVWATLAIILIPSGAFSYWQEIPDTIEVLWPNGQLKELYIEINYTGNASINKTGMYRSWYQNGQLELDGVYFMDHKIHTWIKWDSLGHRIEETSYVGDRKHGGEITWLPNQLLLSSYQYRFGELHGKCFRNKPGDYLHPSMVSEVIWFYVEGDLLVTIKDLRSYDVKQWAENPFYNTDMDLWIEWDAGYANFYVGKQVDGKKHGKWILWTAYGEKKRVDFYRDGELLEF